MNGISKQYSLVITSLFAAIIAILAFTPIGFIQLGVIKATIIHIPVILGCILLGPKIGAVLGGIFGITSLITNTINPALLSFAFSPLITVPGTGQGSPLALVICFIPRIMVGVVPYFVYKFFQKLVGGNAKLDWISLVAAGLAGAMTNTLLVMSLIYFIFKDAFAQARNISIDAVYAAVLGIITMNGVPEALVAGIIIAAIGKVLIPLVNKRMAG